MSSGLSFVIPKIFLFGNYGLRQHPITKISLWYSRAPRADSWSRYTCICTPTPHEHSDLYLIHRLPHSRVVNHYIPDGRVSVDVHLNIGPSIRLSGIPPLNPCVWQERRLEYVQNIEFFDLNELCQVLSIFGSTSFNSFFLSRIVSSDLLVVPNNLLLGNSGRSTDNCNFVTIYSIWEWMSLSCEYRYLTILNREVAVSVIQRV